MDYQTDDRQDQGRTLFNHETLHIYMTASLLRDLFAGSGGNRGLKLLRTGEAMEICYL